MRLEENWKLLSKEKTRFTLIFLEISGENSNYILPEYGAEIAAKFPNYELEEISNAGHWVHAEAPEEFSRAVEDFLE